MLTHKEAEEICTRHGIPMWKANSLVRYLVSGGPEDVSDIAKYAAWTIERDISHGHGFPQVTAFMGIFSALREAWYREGYQDASSGLPNKLDPTDD